MKSLGSMVPHEASQKALGPMVPQEASHKALGPLVPHEAEQEALGPLVPQEGAQESHSRLMPNITIPHTGPIIPGLQDCQDPVFMDVARHSQENMITYSREERYQTVGGDQDCLITLAPEDEEEVEVGANPYQYRFEVGRGLR